MLRREYSSQHPASSTTPPAARSASASDSASTSPASPVLRRHRRRASRSCSYAQQHPQHPQHHSQTAKMNARHRTAAALATTTTTIITTTTTKAAANPALAHKLRQMALPLSPLVQLTTGAVHPSFPANVLQFWLLTDSQLESLAAFYHQRTPRGARPSPWAARYPCPVRWRSDAPLEEKRRRMGRFIGLRGCESPVHGAFAPPPANPRLKTEDEIARDARMARFADESLRRKTPGPWGR